MSTDIYETAADGTGTVRAAFDATAAECRPDIDALTRRALDRGQRVRRHRTVGKAVGSAAAAAAIGLGTVYALNDSGTPTRPANVPGSGTHGGNQGSDVLTPSAPISPSASASASASAFGSPSASAAASATTSITVAPTSTITASIADAIATWRAVYRGPLAVLRAAA